MVTGMTVSGFKLGEVFDTISLSMLLGAAVKHLRLKTHIKTALKKLSLTIHFLFVCLFVFGVDFVVRT